MKTTAEEIADKWSRRLAATHHQLMAMTAVARYGVDFCDTLIADGKSDEPARHFKAKLETAVAMAERFDHNAPPPPAGVNAELLAAAKNYLASYGNHLARYGAECDLKKAIAAAEAGQVEAVKPVRIGVVVEGGIVQEVFADGPAPRVYIIDYDGDTSDHPSVMAVPQDDGRTENARIGLWTPDTSNPSGANETFDAIDAWDSQQ